MSIPTKGEEYSKLIEHLRKAQESAAMLAHLYADESKQKSNGWMMISELMKRVQHQTTQLATAGLQ